MRSGNHQQPPGTRSLSHSSHSSPNWPGQNTTQNPRLKARLFSCTNHRPLSNPPPHSITPQPALHAAFRSRPQWIRFRLFSVFRGQSSAGKMNLPSPKPQTQPMPLPTHSTAKNKTPHPPPITTQSGIISVLSASHQRLKNPRHSLRTLALHPLLHQSFFAPFLRLIAAIPPAHKKPRLPHGKRGP